MLELLAWIKTTWKEDPTFILAIFMAIVSSLAALVEIITRTWRLGAF